MIKVAIHHREGSFSDRWIEYCEKERVDYITVNCYDNDIIKTLQDEGITHLLWHFHHASSKDLMVFPYVMNAADKMGIKTFPDFNTRWHFDDKAAQKYLFESKKIDSPKSYVFYDKTEAISFIKNAGLPIVAKLKRGAGSTNVRLISTIEEGVQYIDTLFSTGILATGKALSNFQQKKRVAKKIKNPVDLLRKTYNFLKKNQEERKLSCPEKGYVYFQEFLPNNSFDTRIIVIGDMAFGLRRFTNDNDFRASGSGKIDYNVNNIDVSAVKKAFSTAEKLKLQCVAFDFVYDINNVLKIIEICFCFVTHIYEGYWDKNIIFHKETINAPEIMIIKTLLANKI